MLLRITLNLLGMLLLASMLSLTMSFAWLAGVCEPCEPVGRYSFSVRPEPGPCSTPVQCRLRGVKPASGVVQR